MPVILIFGIPLIKLLAGIGAVCLGIAGIDQIDSAVKEGKQNRANKKETINKY
jgi:hypothetical protein